MITVYTCVMGGFDNLRPIQNPAPGVRYVCFTDNPLQLPCPGWEFRPAPQLPEVCRAARVAKILPHLMLPPDTDYSIWHDANFELVGDPREMVGQLLRFEDWAAYRHPARDCIYAEAGILVNEKIGTPELVAAEVEMYQREDHPQHGGLWANGLLVRRHSPKVMAVCERWWQRYSEGCERDQISFPVVRRTENMSVNTIHGDIYNHGLYIRFRWHAAFRTNGDNAAFWPERDRMRARLAKLKDLTGVSVSFQEY